jgi:hypothetical protein
MTRRPEDDDGPDPPRDPLMDVLDAYKGAVREHGDGGGHPFGARASSAASAPVGHVSASCCGPTAASPARR